ncbi:MAG TPA: CAAX prenyl protease-related protein [Pirellulales bacterium]|nr:CAAX prenyl protease-related protein [Pirellulales bacterium]
MIDHPNDERLKDAAAGPEQGPGAPPPSPAPPRWLAARPWIAPVLPLVVFSIVGSFEPKPVVEGSTAPAWQLPYSAYPAVYTLKIVLTLVALALVWPALRVFPRRVSILSVVVGIVGVVAWIGLWRVQMGLLPHLPESVRSMLDAGRRSAYNPLAELADRPALAYGFLAVRFFGLTVVIALAEELFLRVFLMRFFVRPDWWNVPFGEVNGTALAVGTAFPMLMHPAELLAAAVWFSLVTWLMIKTRSLWDCVIAHATTNLLLGCYVVWTGAWELW